MLVCTDCLSEGINLQEHFNAVIHYDLSWNPTRHEQREGRVDRYGQAKPEVRVVTYYGHDNPVDGIVLEVLIKKHNTIRTSLGISVPVPANSEQVLEAMIPYIRAELERYGPLGLRLNSITRHMLGLMAGLPGARGYRQLLSDSRRLAAGNPELLLEAASRLRLAA